MNKIRVTVWNEYRHEQKDPEIAKIYPGGIHGAIADYLSGYDDLEVRTATLDQPEHGLTDEVLQSTDVMLWWGHMAHHEVKDEIAAKVQEQVNNGMGLIALHSAHLSKPFTRLMGTSCRLHWRDIGEKERVWAVNPGHPIAAGLNGYFELPHEEMYGEPFWIPQPDEVVFISWFAGGEVFRSGCVFYRGKGRIFYFRPGHETNPTYHAPEVQRVILNAVRFLAPPEPPKPPFFHKGQAPLLEQTVQNG